MGAYASKGVANTALGISIGSGVLALLQNGGLGNILGGGNQLAALQAENAMLKAENYSDKVGKEVYEQSRAENAAVARSKSCVSKFSLARLTRLH